MGSASDMATISAWKHLRTGHSLLREHLTTTQYTEWEELKRRLHAYRVGCRYKPSMEKHAKVATVIRALQKLRKLASELLQESRREDTARAEDQKAAGKAQKLAVIAQIQAT